MAYHGILMLINVCGWQTDRLSTDAERARHQKHLQELLFTCGKCHYKIA